MDNRDDEEIQPYQFEPEWSPGELDTPEYSDNDTDTSDSSSDLEFGDVEPHGWRLIAASNETMRLFMRGCYQQMLYKLPLPSRTLNS